MRIQTRPLTLALATLLAATTIAQKTSTLELSGNVIHSTISDSVHVHVGQGETHPAIDLVLPLDSDGYFLGYAPIQSTQIDLTTWTSCDSMPSVPGYSMFFDETGDTISGFSPPFTVTAMWIVEAL